MNCSAGKSSSSRRGSPLPFLGGRPDHTRFHRPSMLLSLPTPSISKSAICSKICAFCDAEEGPCLREELIELKRALFFDVVDRALLSDRIVSSRKNKNHILFEKIYFVIIWSRCLILLSSHVHFCASAPFLRMHFCAQPPNTEPKYPELEL